MSDSDGGIVTDIAEWTEGDAHVRLIDRHVVCESVAHPHSLARCRYCDGSLDVNLNQSRAVDRLRARILRHGTPRLQMGLIVTITGLAGFLSSVALLRTGVTSMAVRYPLAATIAYLVFLAQLRIWLSFDRHRA